MTITNCNLGDAGSFYMVVVTNKFGSATNSGLQLIVSNVPPGLLYAENFPYLGPNGNYPITGVGWVVAAPANTSVGIYQVGGGLGDAFSYSPTATTNAYYTTDTNDIGISGLPFVDINPASYPYVTFQAGFVPGNAAGQVSGAISVYWAVKMTNGWYCSAQPQAIDLSALSPYQTYQYGFNSAASNWNNLTITSSNAVIGAAGLKPFDREHHRCRPGGCSQYRERFGHEFPEFRNHYQSGCGDAAQYRPDRTPPRCQRRFGRRCQLWRFRHWISTLHLWLDDQRGHGFRWRQGFWCSHSRH